MGRENTSAVRRRARPSAHRARAIANPTTSVTVCGKANTVYVNGWSRQGTFEIASGTIATHAISAVQAYRSSGEGACRSWLRVRWSEPPFGARPVEAAPCEVCVRALMASCFRWPVGLTALLRAPQDPH